MDPVKKKSTVNSQSQRNQRSKSSPSCEERERIKISTSINVSAAFVFSNNLLLVAIMCNKLLRSPKKSSHHVQQAFAFSKNHVQQAFAFSKKVITSCATSFCVLQKKSHPHHVQLLRSPITYYWLERRL